MIILFSILFVAALVFAYFYFVQPFSATTQAKRSVKVLDWLKNPDEHPEWAVSLGEKCDDAPFVFPTNGFIGYLWDDSFRPGHRHSGIDIFGGTKPGITPIVAAHDGYLTRLADWKSTVIIRIPEDPLKPGRQIWTYYTHMADEQGNSFISEEFPMGTNEVFVKAGTVLGYQGNYSGDPGNPTGIHLHFSIVLDDGSGQFLNELDIKNTLDPSAYFQMNLNAHENPGDIPGCLSSLEN